MDDQLQATADLIASEPTLIALVRHNKVEDGAGGWRDNGTANQPPKERFFSGIAADRSVVYNQLGLRRNRIFVLIGMPDDDIQEEDTFTLNGNPYRVVWVDDDRRYQCKAEAIHAS